MDPDATLAPRRRVTIAASLTSLVLFLSSCGDGGSDGSSEPADDAGSDPSDQSGDEAADEPAADTSATTSTSSEPPPSTPPESSAPPEPTAPTLEPVPQVTVDDLPDLITDWEAAHDDPAIEPLDLARRIIGFPLMIPVPDGATVHLVDLDVFTGDPGVDWHWEWGYSAFANAEVGDVDINLDDKGPGTVGLATTYDPIMAELGWRRTGTTTSDPGDPGGPNSVNHVYTYEGEPFTIGGAAVTPDPAFVWLDEDLVFGDEETPGYRIDVDLDLPADIVIVPLVESLHTALPMIDGARLVGIEFSSWDRPPDSFDAEEGLHYLDIALDLELPAGSEQLAMDAYSSLDSVPYRAGEESFFDAGFYQPADPTMFGDEWQQAIVVLDRYPGSISVRTDPDSGLVEVTVEMRLEPNRELLQPLQ